MAQAKKNAHAGHGNPGGGKGMKRSSLWMLIGIGAVVVLAAVIAIGASGGDGGSTGTTIPGQAGSSEYQNVTTTGNPLASPGQDGTDLEIGSPAPDLRGFDFDGAPVDIVPGDGSGPVMLVFLAHWCPHCNAEIPVLINWKSTGQIPANLRIVGIATASNRKQPNWPPSQWLADKNWPWETMADSEEDIAANLYGVNGFPFLVVIDAEGKVKLRTSGEKSVEELSAMVSAALA